MAEESEYDRFIRLSESIANNIPDRHGNEMGNLLIEASGGDNMKLAIGVIAWLLQIGMSEDEAFACFKAAVGHSVYIIFNSVIPEIDIEFEED